MQDTAIMTAFGTALAEAEATIGATAPNPPVGCAALDVEGRLLAVAAHLRAGTGHAEVLALERCRANGLLGAVHSLIVTLEPCNHHGRTPPCTAAIVAAGVREVWIGAMDPNPRVAGGGMATLAHAGVRVGRLDRLAGPMANGFAARCEALIRPFAKWALSGQPWILVKQALDASGSMIPPHGTKTFTSTSSLKLAHVLRRQADAILTGAGTVIADRPLFTVRHAADHAGKRRSLIVLGRDDGRIEDYLAEARLRRFDPVVTDDLAEAVRLAGRAGALSLLVEAGPRVTQAVLDSDLWDQHVTISVRADGGPDDVVWRTRNPDRTASSAELCLGIGFQTRA